MSVFANGTLTIRDFEEAFGERCKYCSMAFFDSYDGKDKPLPTDWPYRPDNIDGFLDAFGDKDGFACIDAGGETYICYLY